MNKKTTIEQMCRDLLELAISEGLVSPSVDYKNPDPQSRTSGELVALANKLQSLLNPEKDGDK